VGTVVGSGGTRRADGQGYPRRACGVDSGHPAY